MKAELFHILIGSSCPVLSLLSVARLSSSLIFILNTIFIGENKYTPRPQSNNRVLWSN